MKHTQLHHHFNDGIFRGVNSATPCARCIMEHAAPEMLEALKLLQSALTEYKLRDVKKRYSLCVADAAASKAIAKAEGRE